MEIAHGAASFDDHCRAIENFSLAIAIRATQPRFFLARGNAFRAIGELERAAKDYGASLALDDRSALYYANRGACYRKLNKTAKALEDLTNAIELDSRKAPHYFNRALVLYDAGFYREAIIDFSKALEDGSTAATGSNTAASSAGTNAPPGGGIGIRLEYRALQTRAKCYRRLGHLPKCIEDLQTAIKLDSRNAPAFSALALAHFECGDFERAAEGFTQAIELNSNNASYFSYRGLCYYRQGQAFAVKQQASAASRMGTYARQCLEDFNKCIQLDGRDPQAYFYRGSVRLAVALDLDQTPTTSSGNTNSAGTMSYMSAAEQLEAAFADIEMALTLCPSGTSYQIGMAMITQLKQHHVEARTMLLYYIGLCYYHEHQPDECVIFMERALEHEPTQELLPNLYSAPSSRNRFSVAHECLTYAYLSRHYHIGLSHALEGRNMDAVEHFTSAYDHSLTEVESIKAGNNQEEEPHEADDKQARLQQLHEVQLLYIHERAKALQLERYHAEALADFSFVIAQQPTNAHAYFRRGFAHKALGDFKTAASDLQTARLLDPNNLQLVVNYKELHDVECIVLCAPGKEKRY
ncbi:hypothetical protein BBJ29_004164 [Phytophthora kernoviae]|uniref:Anaphase-promoting complex subunit 5 domain-containing protein n=1 Tax=Phytophthora kernoviae TaxID=325452 RepID=A0A3F2S3X8_9STRA|nr:hypothetical protein BBJ29_004164 [Phytophthora kernoviae]RLN69250.1 hypothetical protein BBP00_00000513 [Phytophthora kernoviae]